MVCLGLEPGATGWYAQTKTLSYGGTQSVSFRCRPTRRQCYKPFLQEIKIVPHFNLHFIVFKVGSIVCFYTNGPIPASFSLFSSFPHYTIQYIDESVDSVLGIRTRGGRMEGADESTELWRHPQVG